MRLANKLAVVTAAASGMGRAGVELFLKEGAKVVAVDVNADALAQLKSDMTKLGYELTTIQADLSKTDQMKSSINDAAAALGGIDILWAHAGTPGPAGVEDLDLAAYEFAMSLNITSATLAAGEVIKHMRKRGGGSVIFTSSVSGIVGSMMSPIYSAAKFAVVGLTKSLAQRIRSRSGPRQRDLPGSCRHAHEARLHRPLGRRGGSRGQRGQAVGGRAHGPPLQGRGCGTCRAVARVRRCLLHYGRCAAGGWRLHGALTCDCC